MNALEKLPLWVVAAALVLLAFVTSLAAPLASAQTAQGPMAESMRAGWSTYIFVSTTTPREVLVSLAREASAAKAQLVVRGLKTGQKGELADLGATQRFIASIDAQCCGERPVSWVVDPRLFDRYHVTAAPSFVVARGTGAGEADFSQVAGDMALANALKFIAQGSRVPELRERAKAVYVQAFGGNS